MQNPFILISINCLIGEIVGTKVKTAATDHQKTNETPTSPVSLFESGGCRSTRVLLLGSEQNLAEYPKDSAWEGSASLILELRLVDLCKPRLLRRLLTAVVLRLAMNITSQPPMTRNPSL